MAAAVGQEWSSPPPHSISSPDQTSPMYPDRLIRPLPKRRLRTRLSEEEAKTIEFPPNPPQVALFNLPSIERPQSYAGRAPRGEADDHECSCGVDHGVRHEGVEVDNLDGTHERIGRRTGFDEAPLDHQQEGHYHHQAWEHPPQLGGAYNKPPAPPSTTSSADGYESFENTNNKKKRKIPLSGGNHHHSSLSAELVNMTLNTQVNDERVAEDTAGAGAQYYGTPTTPSPGTGISGAGRGRYGRPRHSLDRRPLTASTNGLNAYAGNAKMPPSDQGIISAAIANAAEQATLPSPIEGNENVSLVQQQAAKSISPQNSQFTFSMDSESSKTLYNAPPPAFPAGAAQPIPQGYAQKQQPHMRGGGQTQSAPRAAPPPAGGHPPPAADPNAAPPRRRKPLSKLYQLAARQRKLQQEYQNYHNPPRNQSDVWICEFCEYEAIFGVPPRALIWQYEEKDRRERRRAAEKRRLLEKAKAKNKRKGARKGKGKNNAAAATNAKQQAGNGQQYDDGQGDMLPDLEPEGDEFYDDEFDDGPVEGGPPLPPPGTPVMENGDPMPGGGGGGGGSTGAGASYGGGGGGGGQARAPMPQSRTRKA